MFTGYNLQEFISRFDSPEKCKKYLFDMKWQEGFECVRCRHKGFCNTKSYGELECNKCKHKHSVIAGILFHHLKFDIVKAFLMVFLVSTDKKGVSSLELHRRTGIHAKTCYTNCNFKIDSQIYVRDRHSILRFYNGKSRYSLKIV